ncbi:MULTISPECIES: hypothetical protein [Agrobacterium]|uniref:DUF4376 domain-containing protein n=1 Tax=Agrobacterium TaxID=357 RepID=UPI0009BC0D34|nr:MULTISPECIES: hypothetical protein [Agrobacterium]QCL76039.1 hypothetical protein CFBP5499_21570 [Agrobacterium tumefaciens]CUX69367.1 hypothetical protein AGR6A_Lc90432 [Agrobacterium sp. NCPPB 925]
MSNSLVLSPEDVSLLARHFALGETASYEDGKLVVDHTLFEVISGVVAVPGWQGPLLLDIVKAARVEVLRAACEATITGGFKSSALGAAHTYPSDMKAQINLMGSVTDSFMPNLPPDWQTPFWVCDAANVWSYKAHSAPQIQQAGRDGKALVVRCQAALDELTARVLAAATADAVTEIMWTEGAAA